MAVSVIGTSIIRTGDRTIEVPIPGTVEPGDMLLVVVATGNGTRNLNQCYQRDSAPLTLFAEHSVRPTPGAYLVRHWVLYAPWDGISDEIIVADDTVSGGWFSVTLVTLRGVTSVISAQHAAAWGVPTINPTSGQALFPGYQVVVANAGVPTGTPPDVMGDWPSLQAIPGTGLFGSEPPALGEVTADWAPLEFIASSIILGGTPADRIRSHLSEDAGSLLQATQAAAVEMGVSEAFHYGENVPAGQLRAFSEALTPETVAQRYYPLPTRNQEMLVTVEGETNLGRLAHTVPGGIMRPATSIPDNADGLVTAQQAIQYIVNQWSAQHPRLVFEPIPDLRYVVPGAVGDPRQYYLDNPSAGILTIAAVTIPQRDQRRSMREVLDEWLEVFTGTTLRQTSRGTIELVPRVGPDAPDGVAATLTWDDMLAMSDGEDDPTGIYNRARTTSQGWVWEDETPLIAPSFLVARGAGGIARSVLEGQNVLPTGSRQERDLQAWVRFLDVLADDSPVTIDLELYAYGSWNASGASNFSLEGQVTRQVTLARGQRQDVSITHTSRAQSVTATFRVEREPTGGPDGITVTAPNGIPTRAQNIFGSTFLAYVIDLDVEGTGWVRTNEAISSDWGQAGDNIPGPGGTNILDESRALHGERLATIQSNVFQLTPEQAMDISRSYVLWNINPRTIRQVQQSEWNKYPVKFDHVGRYVDLPNGERAVVENRDYSDSFQPLAGQMQSSFTASVTEVLIDTETEYLYLDNGDFMQLDNGDLVEVS